MTQIFTEEGIVVPVTVVEAGPNVVTQVKTVEKDGYNAIQVGFEDAKEKSLNKPQKGHLAAANVLKKHLKEFRVDAVEEFTVGQEIKADLFAAGEKIDVTGTSKGKGFQGPIKRHGQSRGPESHGSRYHRRPGSMGACSFPGRVFKNKKLAGHMGSVKVTVQNLEVVRVDADKNLILVKGAIPGPKGSMVTIKEAVKFRVDAVEEFTVGQEIKADLFAAGEKIDVTGTSKGKGFQGPIKRHGQSRGPESHGSRYHRRPGSMGACSFPGRVFKNKKLAGHMGSVKVTVQNLEVVRVDADKNLILVKGAIPGPKGSMVTIKEAVKSSK